jgi:uncharacterized membrane protein YgdD (TMEM256/DUF423 family)
MLKTNATIAAPHGIANIRIARGGRREQAFAVAKIFLALSAAFGLTGVAAGAFGAHALRDRLGPAMLSVFQTGVLYHLLHAVALGVIAAASARWTSPLLTAAGWLMVAGIGLFSGSLYALALTGVRGLGAITPLGGLCFLGGWLCILIAALRA